MAPNGQTPIIPWTCPHCQAVWHSGRQYCVDCGYGMAQPVAGTRTVTAQEALRPQPPPDIPPLSMAEQRARELDALYTPQTSEAEALKRSMAAESALQADVALLRETCGQLRSQMGEQRRTLTEGVQAMLAPLKAYFAAQRVEVPLQELVPEVVRRLEERSRMQAQLLALERQRDAPARPPARPVPAPGDLEERLEEVGTQVGELAQAVRLLAHRLRAVEEGLAPKEPEPPSPDYATWVMTDARQAEVERAIQEAQGRRGGTYSG